MNLRPLGLLGLIATCASASASTPVEVERVDSVVRVSATIEARASPELCFAVLTDFDHMADFLPGLKSSRLVSLPGEPLRLRQVGRSVLGLSSLAIDVTLAVTLDPPHEFTFTEVVGNLRQMRGRWHVAGDPTHCTIDYRAEIEPNFWVPPLIGPLLIKRQVREQVDALVAEIHRRAQAAPTYSPSAKAISLS
ncbi:MAG: SRPBCC family protein [Steroidobacteraceae bacterium]|nr:SRPBCC family protein [Steroidobacteraceae bacterium]